MTHDQKPAVQPSDAPAEPKPVAHEQRPEQPMKQIANTQDQAREEAEDDGA